MLRLEEEWEGAYLHIKLLKRGSINKRARQLRDPSIIFEKKEMSIHYT